MSFKGKWSTSFDPKYTREAPFHLDGGKDKTCRMMNAVGTFDFFENKGIRSVRLPYGDSLYSMILLQPKDNSGVPGLIRKLANEPWFFLMNEYRHRVGAVYLPRFNLGSDQSLEPLLTAQGMGIAFSDSADFSGIRASGGLKISQLLHKAQFNVNEMGTGSADEGTMGNAVMTGDSSELIRLDRPFVVAIVDRDANSLLFLGRIMDPAL